MAQNPNSQNKGFPILAEIQPRKLPKIKVLLRFLWKVEACWNEIEFTAVKEDGVPEVIKVTETAC